jgi:hypothetical protein
MIKMPEPEIYEVKTGWAARRDGWAVQASTQEEALRLLQEAEAERKVILEQPMFFQQINKEELGYSDPSKP